MDPIEQLQSAAASLLEKAQQSAAVSDLAVAVDKATGVLRLCSELETSRAQARRLALEERKLEYENDIAPTRGRFERLKEYVSFSTPIVAIVTLTLTLFFQSWQFLKSEKDKAEAAEEAQWQDALKSISASAGLSATAVQLNRFIKSPKYGDLAKEAVVKLLANTTDTTFFTDMFGSAFVPAGWNSLDYMVRIDRALSSRERPLLAKSWTGKTDDLDKLDQGEKQVYAYLDSVVPGLCGHIGSVLKQPRPKNFGSVDLSATYFWNCDWQGADLSNSNIEGIYLDHVDIRGANLQGISQCGGAYLWRVAWWDAAKISPLLLAYLEKNHQYDKDGEYGPYQKKVTPQQYAAAFERLKHETPSDGNPSILDPDGPDR